MSLLKFAFWFQLLPIGMWIFVMGTSGVTYPVLLIVMHLLLMIRAYKVEKRVEL